MHFTASVLALAASAAVCNGAAVPNGAPTVTFWTLDDLERTVYFTPNAGFPNLPSVKVDNSKNTTVEFPLPWIGNYYAVQKGKPNKPGMLGEVNFGGWQGKTYFDVSAIVAPNDVNNVKQMWPVKSLRPMSGCEKYPNCPNAYNVWDDVQTKVTNERNLMTTLGEGSTGISF